MKKLFFLFAFLLSVAVTAQNQVTLRNNSSIDMIFRMFEDASGGCGSPSFQAAYFVPANSVTVVTATNPGFEFVFADIGPATFCTPSFGLTVSTPMSCTSICSGVGPFFDSASNPNPGCLGGLSTFDARWTDCYTGGTGLVVVLDY